MPKSRVHQLTKQEFLQIVKESTNVREIAQKIGTSSPDPIINRLRTLKQSDTKHLQQIIISPNITRFL